MGNSVKELTGHLALVVMRVVEARYRIKPKSLRVIDEQGVSYRQEREELGLELTEEEQELEESYARLIRLVKLAFRVNDVVELKEVAIDTSRIMSLFNAVLGLNSSLNFSEEDLINLRKEVYRLIEHELDHDFYTYEPTTWSKVKYYFKNGFTAYEQPYDKDAYDLLRRSSEI